MILNIGSRFHRPRGLSVPQAVPVLSRLFIPQPTCWSEAGCGAGQWLPRGLRPSDSGAKRGAGPWELPTAVRDSLFLLWWRFESTARESARAVPSGVAWGLRVVLSPLRLQQPLAGRALARAALLPPYTPSSFGCAALCRLPAGTWHGGVPPRCSVPPALSPLLLAPLPPRPPAVPGSPVPLPETFPPVSVTSASERPRIADSGECSSCPLLYLLHLANLMTGGMRSISNMASFAGSGQSTQEAFLHTPIPACRFCSLLPWASRCGVPVLLQRAGTAWGRLRGPAGPIAVGPIACAWLGGGRRTDACFTGRIRGVPEAVGRGTPAPGSP